MILARGPVLTPRVPRPISAHRGGTAVGGSERLEDVQAEHIRLVLDSCGWRIRGMRGAAERLGMKPTTLETRMAKLGIVRNKETAPIKLAIARA